MSTVVMAPLYISQEATGLEGEDWKNFVYDTDQAAFEDGFQAQFKADGVVRISNWGDNTPKGQAWLASWFAKWVAWAKEEGHLPKGWQAPKILTAPAAQSVFDQAFHPTLHRDPRSPEYKAGVLAALHYRMGEQPATGPDPYPPGSCQSDAWHAGTTEGHRLWREFLSPDVRFQDLAKKRGPS